MSIWARSRAANTQPIAPTRVMLRTTAFRLAGIVPSMRCGLTRPHLRRWRRSRITSPSTRTVSTRSVNRGRRPDFGGSGRATGHKATNASHVPATTHVVERHDELFGVKSIAVVEFDSAQNYRAVRADQISRRYRD